MARISGKACVVTGAGSGIGRATAVRLAEECGSVLAVDISPESVAETVDEIARAGGTALAHTADVSDSAAVDAMVAECVARFGSIDVLVNNAGVNLPGVLHEGAIVMLTKGVALDYAKQGIRCNAICPGWVDTPINHAHAALLGGLDKVYAEIDSFQPIGRPGEPREIANVALFLASDESSFMTGSIVVADGGMTSQ